MTNAIDRRQMLALSAAVLTVGTAEKEREFPLKDSGPAPWAKGRVFTAICSCGCESSVKVLEDGEEHEADERHRCGKPIAWEYRGINR